MAIDLNITNIDLTDPVYEPLLRDLQGNILKSHGRENALHLFLRFTAEPAAVRYWLRDFSQHYVGSAADQLLKCEIFRKDGTCGGLFANFLLTAAGYRRLGYDEDQLPADASFRAGLKRRRDQLSDPPVAAWEPGFQDEIHALILLADDQAPRMNAAAAVIRSSLNEIAEITSAEPGATFRNDRGQAIEHFGFVDGISQPLFLAMDIEAAVANGSDGYNPSAPLSLVLRRDPHGAGETSFGSFMVFRKLEQDVNGFRAREKELAARLGVDAELAAAYTIGRFRDGTPVILHDRAMGAEEPANDFNYGADPHAARCPYHAHARKVNPRGEAAALDHTPFEQELGHRIVRRGISYGPLTFEPALDEKVGLLFMCMQGDIGNQFEYMQSAWANKTGYAAVDAGLDAIVGQGKQTDGGQRWPRRWGDEADKAQFNFANFVTMRGGEYFFAPSLSFLRQGA